MECTEGHDIPPGTGICVYGHSAATIPAENGLMVHLKQQMISLQQENIDLRRGQAIARHTDRCTIVKKPDRPIIEQEATDNDWAMFTDQLARYKDMTNLRNLAEIRNELRSTCSREVNKLLFDLVGAESLNTSTEQELLQHKISSCKRPA